jgi:hypothetical protein
LEEIFIFLDVIFIIGDGMINNPELKEIKGPFEFWEKKPELRERLFNQKDLFTPKMMHEYISSPNPHLLSLQKKQIKILELLWQTNRSLQKS